jgi:outer membrane lipoprotein-sorting protein
MRNVTYSMTSELTTLIFRTVRLTLMILILSTSCSVPGLAPQIDIPPSLVQQSNEAAQAVQDAHLRVELELSNSLLRDKQVLEIWYMRPDSVRLEILESTLPAFRDIISASQGDSGWIYKHAERQVVTGPIDSVKPAMVYDIVRSALGLLFDDHLDRIETASTDYINGQWVFKLVGSRDVDSCTLWLNKDSFLPVKAQCESQQLGQYTLTIQEAEYNLGLTDNLFEVSFLPTDSYTIRPAE